ncbi:MAG TPA: transposase [Polyangiales bacterium]
MRVALQQHGALCEGLLGSRRKLSAVLLQLRRALGISASSERRCSGEPLGPVTQGDRMRPKSKRERLELNIERSERLLGWHKELIKRHGHKLKATRSKLMGLPVDPELGDDERSEADKAADQAEVREQMVRLQLGAQAQPALESSSEAFMTGAQVATVEVTLPLLAPPDEQLDGKVIDTIIEERERFDFTFTVRRITVQVQKKVIAGIDGERRVVSASTAALGPPRYAVTWEFLAHMSVLVAQYAMPMNRLSTLLSTDEKRFSAGALSRLLRYVAQRFAPIYLTLFDCLADAGILSGDDTSCRVIEVNRHFASQSNQEGQLPPWHHYRNVEAACELLVQGDDSLAAALASELGFEHERRNGDGAKRALHTTTLSGRSDADDPRSLVVLYRSHLGGFGDLLQMLLRKRNPKRSALTIQSDLATVNLVADQQLQRLFTVRYAGCGSHARRPFALYEHEDPVYCAAMLHLFKGLFIHEHNLNLVGRNADNVLAVRDVDSRALWQQIKELCQEMSQTWSRETKLGEAVRYVTRNFDKLTTYLNDPRLELTNNFSERMLRMEKLIENSSLFRTSLEGRFALDIMRTVLQTAVAARAPLQLYLLAVLRAPPDEVAAAPERFTPLAWATAQRAALAEAADPEVDAIGPESPG